jgi:hypothetical protein
MSTSKVKAILKTQREGMANIIEEASCTLGVGQQVSVSTALGVFILNRIKGEAGLFPTSGRERWSPAQSIFEEILAFFERTIEAKNQQLDTEADRRVLVISDNAPFGKDLLLEAAQKFFGENREDISNIDEVFIEFRENDFVRVYSTIDC